MIKVDFHIHTSPASYEPKQFDFSLETLKSYVSEANLDVIAITNHNHFDSKQYLEIEKELNSITVFPGVEVDLEKGHMLVIAPNDLIDEICDSCKELEKRIIDNRSSITYDDFIRVFPYYQKVLLIPHYRKEPKLPDTIINKFNGLITAGEVTSPKKFYNCKNENSTLVPVYFSDFRVEEDKERKAFPNKNTYIDIQTSNFTNIKIALSDKTKVFLNKEKKAEVFEYTTNGSIASTKLNVVIGKRSSGKTYNLNRVWDTRDSFGKSIHYIKQFSLTGDSEEGKFNELRKKEKDSIIINYLSSLKDLTSLILTINLSERDQQLQNYVSTLLEYANNMELNDEYSKTKLFNEILFNYQEKHDTKKVINAVVTLLNSKDNMDLIEKHIDIEGLRNLLAALLQRLKEQLIEKELHDWADKIVKKVKDGLKNKSVLTPPTDIDMFGVYHDRVVVQRYNQLTNYLKTEKVICEDDIQRFSLIAKRRAYTGAQDVKNHVDPLPAIGEPYKEFYAKGKMYEYVHALKKLSITEDKIYRCIVAIDIELKNQDGKDLSGGERAEFNLIKEIQNASGLDVLLIDEPEASFDNPFIRENIINLIKELSEKMTVFVSTHNNTIGLLMHPNMIIYTEKTNGEFITYHGELGDKELKSPDNMSVLSYEKIIDVMEAGDEAYKERKVLYENLKDR